MKIPLEGIEKDGNRNRLIMPFLSILYTFLQPYGYAIMRLALGCIIASFGWAKLFGDKMPDDIALFQRLGLEPAVPLAYFIGGLEFFGGLAVAVGFLTRPIAAMLFGEFLVILLMVMIPRHTGYQFSVVCASVLFFIVLHGGGRFSIDRLLGKEF